MLCNKSVTKIVLFVFNFLFVVAGLVLMIMGIGFYSLKDQVGAHFDTASTLVIITGIILIINASFGCFGSLKESYWILGIYVVPLLTLFVIQLAIGIYAYLQVKPGEGKNDQIQAVIAETLTNIFKNYDSSNEVREFFDTLQRQYHCCGPNGPLDYKQFTMPSGCCGYKVMETCNVLQSYKSGCAAHLAPVIISSVHAVVYVVEVFAVVELIGALVAIRLFYLLRNESKRRQAVRYTPNRPL